MRILENEFVKISFNQEKSLAIAIWKLTTENMGDEEYKEVFLKIGEVYKQHEVKYWLGDAREFYKLVSIELQEWTVKELNPLLFEAGLKRMALIMPSELIANFSVGQVVSDMEKGNNSNFQAGYFNNWEEAKKWILS